MKGVLVFGWLLLVGHVFAQWGFEDVRQRGFTWIGFTFGLLATLLFALAAYNIRRT